MAGVMAARGVPLSMLVQSLAAGGPFRSSVEAEAGRKDIQVMQADAVAPCGSFVKWVGVQIASAIRGNVGPVAAVVFE